MEKCKLCPHKCNVDRSLNVGRCKAENKIEIRTDLAFINLKNLVEVGKMDLEQSFFQNVI